MSTRSGRVRSSIADTSPRRRKIVSSSRSPARNRKSSTERIARQSPARRSPSRKPVSKYPARKSPSRTVKKKEDFVTKSPTKRAPINANAEGKLDDFSAKFEIYRSTRSKRIEYTVNDIPLKSVEDATNGVDSTDSSEYSRNRRSFDVAPTRSSRLRDFVENVPVIRQSLSKSLSKSVSKSKSKTIDTYYDDESELALRRKSTSVVRKLSTPVPSTVSLAHVNNKFEFGGVFGAAALIFAIPLIAFEILITCSKLCSHNTLLNIIEYKSISWFTVPSLVIILGQHIIQGLILLVPTLRTKQVDEGDKRYFNAVFSSILTFCLLLVLDFYKIISRNIILEAYLQLGAISYVVAVLLSILLYLKSKNINENFLNLYGNSKSSMYNFFIGREVNPQIKKFNIKLWSYRVCNVTTLILLILILLKQGFHIDMIDLKNITLNNYQEMLTKVQWRPTIVVFTMMQIIYALYFIILEYKVITTFYWQFEGLGYMQLTATALYPFYFTTISKYVADSGIAFNLTTLVAASAIFLAGFFIMLVSNNIKYEFRKNPLEPRIVHLDSMPTFHGKKLLVSNLWGFVRHPNYLGDILIHISLALPGILSSRPIAALPALLPIIVLIHRAWRDHCRCRRRYGAAWQRYCKRVPSFLLPKVF